MFFLKAAKEKCNKRIRDINADDTLGFLYLQTFVYDGTRQSAAKAYLVPAKNRPNLCIIKNAQAYKILFDKKNKRAIGVQYEYKEQQNFTAYAKKEVVLSGGTIGSAQLLLLSGIGPKNQLQNLDIATISDLPVGENLIDHILVMIFYKFDGEPPSDIESLDDTYNYLIYRNGPLASVNGADLSGFLNSKNNSKFPDIQHLHTYFTQNSSGLIGILQLQNFALNIQQKLMEVNANYHIGLGFVALVQPKSVGSMRLRTSSFKDHPSINANYFNHPDDMETMVRAVKYEVSFENTKSFKKHNGEFIQLPICNQFK